jgi:hypothetical protein
VYFTEALSGAIVLLLVGGDKSTQKSDIKRAKQILRDLKQLHSKAKAEAGARIPSALKGTSRRGKR